ncbi:MAG: holo-ACP synthase [Actinomycetota bacterium]
MSVVSIGVDVCDIGRMERALARHVTMPRRVFTPEEVAYCETRARPAESYAGRFAAREAVIKALGGYMGKKWQDISITRAPSGEPAILLSGNAKKRAEALGIERFLISFSHERTMAMAFAVGVGR